MEMVRLSEAVLLLKSTTSLRKSSDICSTIHKKKKLRKYFLKIIFRCLKKSWKKGMRMGNLDLTASAIFATIYTASYVVPKASSLCVMTPESTTKHCEISLAYHQMSIPDVTSWLHSLLARFGMRYFLVIEMFWTSGRHIVAISGQGMRF